MNRSRCIPFLLLGFSVATRAQVPNLSGAMTDNPPPTASSTAEMMPRLLSRSIASLGAGGAIAAEGDPDAIRYFSAGDPAPRPGIAPEKVIFEIGSITKVFTGLLLAEAVVEHKVSLDDPISRYLPDTVAMDPSTAAITLAQLSTHTSGLPRLPDNLQPKDRLDPYADYTVEELYAFLRSYKPKDPQPYPFEYSNLGAGLLGHILGLVYHQSYAELVAAKISQPLNLPDTVVNLSAEQETRFAPPHTGSQAGNAWHLPTLAGAGALHSTAADLVRLAGLLMSPDKNPLRAAWEIARQPRAGSPGNIGLNVMILQRNQQAVYWHNGGTGGFRTYFEWAPQPTRHVLVVLMNNGNGEPEGIAAQLYAPPANGLASNKDRLETTLPEGREADYLGVYALNPRARLTFLKDPSGRIEVRLTGQRFSPIFFAGNDRFFLRAVQADLQFERAPGGEVTAVTLVQNGQEQKARRTADPVPTVLFLSAAKLNDYVGRYSLAPGAEFTILIRGGWPFVQLTGQQPLAIFSDRPDHFVTDVVDAAITFERDANGAVSALVLHQNGRDQRASRLPAEEPNKTPPSTP